MMRKNRKSLVRPLVFVLSLLVLFVIVVTLVFAFARKNDERITEQNRQYLEDASAQTVKRIEEIFENALDSAAMVSRLYELRLTEPKFDYKLLNYMSSATPFDYVRFVGMDGISFAGDGTTQDCSDREYYLKGMNGQSGIYYCRNSRFTNTSVLIFYAPLYYDARIIGVVNGVMEVDSLSEKLSTTFFGKNSDIAVILSDGTIAISTWKRDGQVSLSEKMSFTDKLMDENEPQKAMSALGNGESYSFRYSCNIGDGIAQVAPILNGQFLLVQTFPSVIITGISQKSNHETFLLEIALVAVFGVYILLVVINAVINSKVLEKAAVTDGLTGLYNRREMQAIIENQLITSDNRNFCLVMMDIDNFKRVNDTYGHQMGDNVIRELSTILKGGRCKDFWSGRWGGEEFMLLLPNTEIAGAKEVAEYIRRTFEEIKYSNIPSQTLSIGVTQVREGDTVDMLCTRVDDALYDAKRSGKNKVTEK